MSTSPTRIEHRDAEGAVGELAGPEALWWGAGDHLRRARAFAEQAISAVEQAEDLMGTAVPPWTLDQALAYIRAQWPGLGPSTIPPSAWHDLSMWWVAEAIVDADLPGLDRPITHAEAADMLALSRSSIGAYVEAGDLERTEAGGGVRFRSVLARLVHTLERERIERLRDAIGQYLPPRVPGLDEEKARRILAEAGRPRDLRGLGRLGGALGKLASAADPGPVADAIQAVADATAGADPITGAERAFIHLARVVAEAMTGEPLVLPGDDRWGDDT